ncbi:MAG: ankyrin repeat domain-containing protein [Phycisphaerae bacterium]|jgi:ankyrin repeat protein
MSKVKKIILISLSILLGFCLWLTVCGLIFVKGCQSAAGERPIHRAAFKGDIEKVRKIIEKNPNQVNVQDFSNKTPLYYSSAAGHVEVVKFLLAHGANIELGNDHGERPLAKAAKFKHYDVAKILLEHGAKVNCKDDSGYTPLHEASLQSGKDMVNLLLEYGADVSARNEYAYTPLHQAATMDNIEAAKALIGHGADVFAKTSFDPNKKYEQWELDLWKDTMNKTPQEIAVARGFKELAEYLQVKENEKISATK